MWKFATLVIFNFEFTNVGNRENNVSNKTVDKKLIKKSLTLKTKYNFCAANKTHLKVSPLKFKLPFKIYLNSVLQNMQKNTFRVTKFVETLWTALSENGKVQLEELWFAGKSFDVVVSVVLRAFHCLLCTPM